jgi:hypothetical protein
MCAAARNPRHTRALSAPGIVLLSFYPLGSSEISTVQVPSSLEDEDG